MCYLLVLKMIKEREENPYKIEFFMEYKFHVHNSYEGRLFNANSKSMDWFLLGIRSQLIEGGKNDEQFKKHIKAFQEKVNSLSENIQPIDIQQSVDQLDVSIPEQSVYSDYESCMNNLNNYYCKGGFVNTFNDLWNQSNDLKIRVLLIHPSFINTINEISSVLNALYTRISTNSVFLRFKALYWMCREIAYKSCILISEINKRFEALKKLESTHDGDHQTISTAIFEICRDYSRILHMKETISTLNDASMFKLDSNLEGCYEKLMGLNTNVFPNKFKVNSTRTRIEAYGKMLSIDVKAYLSNEIHEALKKLACTRTTRWLKGCENMIDASVRRKLMCDNIIISSIQFLVILC